MPIQVHFGVVMVEGFDFTQLTCV